MIPTEVLVKAALCDIALEWGFILFVVWANWASWFVIGTLW